MTKMGLRVIEPPPNIDPMDRGTWVNPVVGVRKQTLGAHIYRAEYNIPITPNSLIMAMAQLPPFVPRGNPTFVRVMMTRANVKRDGRNTGGFAVEAHWPLAEIMIGYGSNEGS
jgi:hypothetical protein